MHHQTTNYTEESGKFFSFHKIINILKAMVVFFCSYKSCLLFITIINLEKKNIFQPEEF
jgi:hypothetical protein